MLDGRGGRKRERRERERERERRERNYVSREVGRKEEAKKRRAAEREKREEGKTFSPKQKTSSVFFLTLGVEVVRRLDGVALALDRVLDRRGRHGDVEGLDHERLALRQVDDRRVADVVVVVERLGRPQRLRVVDLHARLAADVVAVLEPGRAEVDGLAGELRGGGQAGERAALAGVVADEEVGAVLLGAGGDQRVAQVRRVVEVLGGGVGERGREGEVVELFGGVDAAAVED